VRTEYARARVRERERERDSFMDSLKLFVYVDCLTGGSDCCNC